MKIGILVTGHAPDELKDSYGQYPRMFADLLDGHGLTFASWPVLEMEFPDSPEDADGWLITGSRFGVYEDLPWIAPLKDFIRAIYDAGRPLVGICFGHQIMAEALGGRAEKSAKGWGTGRHDYTGDAGEVVSLNAFHQDQVTIQPPGTRVIASSPFCEYAALSYRANTLSMQPHPEFPDPFIASLVRARASILPPEHVAAADQTHDKETSTAWAVSLIVAALQAGNTPKTP